MSYSTKFTVFFFWCFCLLLGACTVLHPLSAYLALPIRGQDRKDLRNGNLLTVRERYEARKPHLNDKELAILCDIYVQHVAISDAFACLDEMKNRPVGAEISDIIDGKRALVAYLLGEYERAANLSKNVESDGGHYVYALSQIRLGNNQPASDKTAEWALSYEPARVFLAANLFLAMGQYDKVLETLQDPERRLHWDYSLSGGADVFGNHIKPAPLRVDLFGEFGFGLLDTYSFAPPSNVYVEYALAKAELETGNIDKARERYETILNFKSIGAYRDVQWRALSDRARIAELEEDPEGALVLYRQSIEVIESARSSIPTDAGRIGFAGDKQEVYGNVVRLLVARGGEAEAFEFSERARSRALVDLLASVRKFGPRGTSQQVIDTAIRDYERAEIELAEARESAEPAEIERRTRYLTKEGRNLLRYKSAHELAVLLVVKPMKLVEIQDSLEPDEGLLNYYHDGTTWRLFLVTRSENHLFSLNIKDLAKYVVDFRWALRNSGNYTELAKKLYNQLIRPAEEKLPKKLTIVPYGTLHYLPFAALMSSDNNFLIQEYTIAMLPSASVMRFLKPEPGSRRILAVGNPRPDKKEYNLPGAEAEAIMVAKTRKSSTLFLRHQATEEEFLNSAPDHGILHIASHGRFFPKAPLESRLLFAPSLDPHDRDPKTDGYLTVMDLLGVDTPWGAQIAILSACESSVTEVKPGQDIVGLQRGFFYAGTDSIVGTLWPIPDEATFYLMKKFYFYLNQGDSAAEALRKGQLNVIGGNQHPADWAAFIFTGLNR